MLLDIDPQVMSDGEPTNAMQLILLIGRGQHRWHVTLPSALAVEEFLQRHRLAIPALEELAAKAVEEAGYARAAPPWTVKITVTHLDALIADLTQPAYVVVENSRWEGTFLREVARILGRSHITFAIECRPPWLVFENAGGKDVMDIPVRNRLAQFQLLYRVAALIDSDKKDEHDVPRSNRDVIDRMRAIDGFRELHVWRGRESENYLPIAILRHHHPSHEAKIATIFKVPQQRMYTDIKSEIGGVKAERMFPAGHAITSQDFDDDVRAELEEVLSMIERIL
ncbi:hypothetical protein AB0M47_08770 [Hamadaea sp. NPDC051192]|uniref:hypothetical protein n=1 Tax=Hamadaea sp. NPDC051192 TaxID=3154940 RepID=UPI00341B48E6